MHIITYETQNEEETDIHHIHSPMQMQKNAFPKFNAAPLAFLVYPKLHINIEQVKIFQKC